MNETIREWIAKAEADYATAQRELQVTSNPNYDGVCFHSQQCIEKVMKALLIQLGVTPPKTHDLTELDRLLSPVCAAWSWPPEELRFLTRAAVEFRYPGGSADYEEAALALERCSRMRAKLQPLFAAR